MQQSIGGIHLQRLGRDLARLPEGLGHDQPAHQLLYRPALLDELICQELEQLRVGRWVAQYGRNRSAW